ncbi:MAG TPA: methyltransferase domain-containing protein [Syntrophomonadaceae bacterium]|nr:methyltransferase domain-containing protein [Syntrophomonadaceae bacterium]
MILKKFFTFYFGQIEPEVLDMYRELIGDSDDLARDYAEIFSRNDENAIEFLLKFHRATNKLREERPDQAILFNVSGNVCFPFFVEYIWEKISAEKQNLLLTQSNSNNLAEVIKALDQDVGLRNWFRQEIGHDLSQDDLFTMNEVIALQNFSSGGEFSFLEYVFSRIRGLNGKVLDAGCGAGFATLIMSQYMEVYAIDACKARLERAMALSDMMKKGEKQVFPQVIQLIEDELGGIDVVCEFPTAESLLSGNSKKVEFLEGSIDSLPYADNFFEAINCLDVLEHTYDPAKIIEQFSRVVKSGGQVFITAPTRYGEVEQRIYESIDGTLFPAMLHMHHFSPESLDKLFEEAGFKNVATIPFDYMKWDDFMEIAERSPAKELAEELKNKPFDEVALQLFAVYEKI